VILPDVNVLVNAFRSDASHHLLCRGWLNKVVNGDSHYAISPQVLSGVIRVTTHPKVFVQPSTLGEVIDFCDALMKQPHCKLIFPESEHWYIFVRLCKDSDVRGNLVPDAWYAALAVESGCEWVTLDRDYARFPGLKWMLPS
jgi:toxin-antitoxin system PIN domain toxin